MASGANVNVLWGHELTAGGADNFGLGASKINKNFGTETEVSELKYDPSVSIRYNLGSRSPVGFKSARRIHTFNVEFDLQSPYIWEEIVGPDSGGPTNHNTYYYDYDFLEAESLGSMEIQVAETIASGSYLFREIEGAMVQKTTMTVDQSADEPIRMVLDCLAKTEKRSNAIPAAFTSALYTDTVQQFTFGEAKWYLATSTSAKGAEIAMTDKLDLTFDQGFVPKYALGDSRYQRKFFGERKYEITCLNLFDDAATYMDNLYGASLSSSATAPTEPQWFQNDQAKGLCLEIVGSQDASYPVTYQWFFTGIIMQDHSGPIHGPKEELMESVRMVASHCNFRVDNMKEAQPTRYG